VEDNGPLGPGEGTPGFAAGNGGLNDGFKFVPGAQFISLGGFFA
jgi:hypothetical protein